MFLRIRLWMAPGRRRARGRGPARVRGRLHARARIRRPAALLFPIALVMATATIVLVARFGGAPRCSATTTAATAKPFPGGGQPQKSQKSQKGQKAKSCPPVLNPLFTGR